MGISLMVSMASKAPPTKRTHRLADGECAKSALVEQMSDTINNSARRRAVVTHAPLRIHAQAPSSFLQVRRSRAESMPGIECKASAISVTPSLNISPLSKSWRGDVLVSIRYCRAFTFTSCECSVRMESCPRPTCAYNSSKPPSKRSSMPSFILFFILLSVSPSRTHPTGLA